VDARGIRDCCGLASLEGEDWGDGFFIFIPILTGLVEKKTGPSRFNEDFSSVTLDPIGRGKGLV
jgi:hypothetical protein